jgi:hypothetical protein
MPLDLDVARGWLAAHLAEPIEITDAHVLDAAAAVIILSEVHGGDRHAAA